MIKHNITNLGYGLYAAYDNNLISLITISHDLSAYYAYILNKTGHTHDKLIVQHNILSQIQTNGNLSLAISINTNSCRNICNHDLVQVDYSINKTIIKYDFDKKINDIRASCIDRIKYIYYACVQYHNYVMIHAINIKNYTLISIYGPLSFQQHYAWKLLYDKDRLYAFIHNMEKYCIQLVIVNIHRKLIETTLTYDKFSGIYAISLQNNIIYAVMLLSGLDRRVAFVTIDLYSKHYEYMIITNKHLPLNMWII